MKTIKTKQMKTKTPKETKPKEAITALEIGKWYKGTAKQESGKENRSTFCVTSLADGVTAYGIDFAGEVKKESPGWVDKLEFVELASKKEIIEAERQFRN